MPKRRGGDITCRSSTHDHDRGQRIHLRNGAPIHSLEFLPSERHAFADLDAPALKGIEGRRAKRLTRLHVEAGVMPRAADGIAPDEPIGERGTVMRAERAERESLVAVPDEDRGFSVNMTAKDLSFTH
jgi:hypothetical protein